MSVQPIQILESHIPFSKAEADELIGLLDRLCRAEGLQAAHMAGYFFKKINEAFSPQRAKQKGESQNGNQDALSA